VEKHRTWPVSIGVAFAMTAVILAVAVGANYLIPGRVLHWDIVALMGAGGLVALTLAARFRLL
jgi:hypothetical protein